MRDVDICGVMFALLALFLGWLTWSALRWREIPGKYGVTLTPGATPRRYWFLVGFQAVLTGLAVAASAVCFLSPVR